MSGYTKVAIGFVIGNFLWQAFTSLDWGVAVERSFFQCAAIFICAIAVGAGQ